MAQLKSKQLQNLLLQAQYAPTKHRLRQIDACQALLRLIKSGKKYPFEFICFYLTGYRPRKYTEATMLDYEDLLGDLPLYAEQLSQLCPQPVESFTEKIYSIPALTRRFRVCSKTIRRWRRKGLTGRYFIFPDGRRRLGFVASSVDFFIQRNRGRVRQGKKFTHLIDSDRSAIIEHLGRWAQRCPQNRQEAIRRTARKFGRSVETVRKILSDQEKLKNHAIQFTRRQWAMDRDLRQEIYQLFKQGKSVQELMKQFQRSKSNIYRAINMEAGQELLALPIHYISAEEFTSKDARNMLYDSSESGSQANQSASADITVAQNKPLESIAAYYREISGNNILSFKDEQLLFRKYNYIKFLAAQCQKQIQIDNPSGRKLKQLKLYLNTAGKIKHHLITSNLRLVVSIARKHAHSDPEMLDLISEGNLTLLNAVEKFDFNRQVKFSTYASWAIIKKYATLKTKQLRRPAYIVTEEILEVAHNLRIEDSKVTVRESARKSLLEVITDTLEEREKIIVKNHFGLTSKTEIIGERKALSLAQISRTIGLSKERVRQIELAALQKLRRVLTPDQFDLLTQS